MTLYNKRTRNCLLPVLFAFFTAFGVANTRKFPLKISQNGRHLVEQDGKPFLIHGDSPWEAVWRLTKAEWAEYLDRRVAQGFNSVLFNLLPDDRSTNPWTKTRDGFVPFKDPNDFTTMNADYFDHAESFVAAANERGLMVLLFPCYLGILHTWIDELHANGVAKTRAYGKLLADRFGKYPNIIWIVGGDLDPQFAKAEVDALAESLYEHSPTQLITFHGREHSSAVIYPDAKWLALNATYDYGETYSQSHEDWARTPARPTFMSESGYEREANDRRWGTPQRMRRQAYWTLLSGSCGHYYGTLYWSLKPGWREHLDWPGARHMTHVREFFERLPWTELVPRFEQELILDGNGVYGSGEDYITAAATPDRRVAALYMPVARRVKVNLGLFPGPVQARWFDPTMGNYTDAAAARLPNNGSHVFTPPDRDSDNDWALVLGADTSAGAALPLADLRYYELRIYHALAGQANSVLAHLRGTNHEDKKRDGLKPVACWLTHAEEQGEKIIELLKPADGESASTRGKDFHAEPELGRLCDKIEVFKLFAPASAVTLDRPSKWPDRVFELQLHRLEPGGERNFKTRWRENAIGIYERQLMQSLGWWEVTGDVHPSVFVALLANESFAAIEQSTRWFHQEGTWQRLVKETERYGKISMGMTSYKMTAADFSELK